jgi:NADH dehydrogenase (ubiquinone) 1 alpha subcomplex subunit 8
VFSPTPLPSSVPHVDELGVTSAPLKSASFFIGEHCKKFNGTCIPSRAYLKLGGSTQRLRRLARCGARVDGDRADMVIVTPAEDFMLCKAENSDPAHCLKEGRRVTRCAQDL